ncbi:3-deoxy-7-phosphoheptulonate synthase [Candidatus Peregrinibacteria bacterium]|nr:3-deoxy-7-phosphoheptulonate synthase [Candidatus Peregrinibacteria bacterium]
MIIIMETGAEQGKVAHIIKHLEEKGLQPVPLVGTERTVIAVIGEERDLNVSRLEALPGVRRVLRVAQPYKLVSRETQPESTVIEVNGVKIGGDHLAMFAGPCSVESEEQMEAVAEPLAKLGVKLLRGGAFKPRTGPYAFQGLGKGGLEIMARVAKRHGMATCTEVLDPRDVDLICQHADILQIGARNMQNFTLLKEVGHTKKPVFLKRGMSATVEELLLAAEYILSEGNPNVILCERGIRTFEQYVRNTLPLATVPRVKELSHLPIIVDPSHGVGKKRLIPAMCKAAIAAGADGLMIEVHPNPSEALSDGGQSLVPEQFAELLEDIKPIAIAVGRKIS